MIRSRTPPKPTWLDGPLLGDAFPLPLDVPFTTADAVGAGVTPRQLAWMCEAGLLRRVLLGVYAAMQAPDSVAFRANAIALVMSGDAVVTDRAAAWLHGIPILRRGAHLVAPPLEVSHRSAMRSVRPEVEGHRRQLADRDVQLLHGVPVTTALRTACDLGRLLWRFDALAALDGALRVGVSQDELLDEMARFKGFRGVRQLRALAPLADARAESSGESALRLHWLEAGLPSPELQLWIDDELGTPAYRLDIGCDEVRYAAEYDGREFHSSPEHQADDAIRRAWIEDQRAWTIDAFTSRDVYRPGTDIGARMAARFNQCRRRVAIWTP